MNLRQRSSKVNTAMDSVALWEDEREFERNDDKLGVKSKSLVSKGRFFPVHH